MKKYQIVKNFPEYCIIEDHDETSFVKSLTSQNANVDVSASVSSAADEENEQSEPHHSINISTISQGKVESTEDDGESNNDESPRNNATSSQPDIGHDLQLIRHQLKEMKRSLEDVKDEKRSLEGVINDKLAAMSSKFESDIKLNNEELKSIIQFYAEHGKQNKDK